MRTRRVDGDAIIGAPKEILGKVKPRSLEPLGQIGRMSALIDDARVRHRRDHAGKVPDIFPESGNVDDGPLVQRIVIGWSAHAMA